VYKLEKLNVVRIVKSESERQKLLAQGYTEVKDNGEKRQKIVKDTEENCAEGAKKKGKRAAK
jgi:hypothetical protein